MFNKLVSAIVLVLLCALPLLAQDAPVKMECSAEANTAFTETINQYMATLADDPEATLIAMRQAMDTYQLLCSGNMFTSTTNESGIVGPLTLDGTLYEVTLALPEKALTFGSMEWTTLEGDCGLFTLLSITGTDGGSESDVLEFEGCTALFEVNGNMDEWTLTFKKLK